MVSTRARRPLEPEPDAQRTSGSPNRKRQREPDATTPPRPAALAAEADVEAGAEGHVAKKSKQTGGIDIRPVAAHQIELELEAPPADADRSIKPANTSSDTIATTTDNRDDASPLDALSAEERRKLKGKGKAIHEDNDKDGTNGSDERARLTRELAFKDSLIASQTALLANLRSAVSCSVCLETLDKPYALACGHVFCRKCLLEWFFRADTAQRDGAQSGSDSSDSSSTTTSTSTSSSGSTTTTSSSSTSSGSDDDGSHSRSNRSGSTSTSYVGGSYRGQDFRVRGNGTRGTSAATFNALGEQIYHLFGTSARGAVTGTREGGARNANTAGGAISPRARITEAEDDEDEPTDRRATEANADEMRRARLARFGGGGTDAIVPGANAPAAAPHTGAAPAHTSQGIADVPAEVVPRAENRAQTLSRSPTPAAPRRAPSPPRAPLTLPKGEHRTKNLVCPQCRTVCGERAPHRIFVLSELLALVRAGEASGMFHPSSTTPAPDVRAHAPEVARSDLPGLDEADPTWGGLFPGPGGTESASDRRKRLARVVRDRDDGVNRCGVCNWEIDERTGHCEGCGRAWNMTSEGEDSWSDSDDDLALRYRLPTYTSPQRALARRHDEVDDSEHSDDTDESLDSRDQEGEEEEDYESDGFLVRSPPSARGREGVRVMDADTSDGTSSLSSSGESSSSGSSDSESGVVAAAAKRRRARRQEGEVIDLDSDTGDGGGEFDSDSASGTERDQDEEGSPPPVPYRPRSRSRSGSRSGESSSRASEDEDEQVTRPTRRRKRVIMDDDDSD
ncbi:hypothetical protein JCM3766R1_005860 [Sporobolomyces carnicolor]